MVLQRERAALGLALGLLHVASCSSADIVLGTRERAIEPLDGALRSPRDDAGRSGVGRRDARAEGDGGSLADGAFPDSAADAAAGDAEILVDAAIAPKGSAGCGSEPPALDTSIQVNGAMGMYFIDKPADYDVARPYPLLLNLRGAGVTAEMFRRYLNLAREVGSDAIVVSPDCLNAENTWSVARDLPYIDALLSKLKMDYCIDESRIFAAGHAAGAQFANSLGCLRGSQLRAIASLTGNQPAAAAICEGEVAVWIAQGAADPLLLPLGRASRDFWSRRNNCLLSRWMPVSPSPCVEYDGCRSAHPVVYCEYDGDARLPDFAASGVWEFFKQF